ncbi:MAG: hypothetical protein AAGU32_21740, partial [Bacillota bacterium]
NKSEKTFYTSIPQSGTIIPKLGSIAEFNRAIEVGQKRLKDLNHQQYLHMLKNDIPGMDALDETIKAAEQDIDNLKIGLGEVMGAGIHGPSGNQLTGSGWFGRAMGLGEQEEGLRAPIHGKPLFAANDTQAHVTELDDVVEYPPEPQAPPQIEDIPTWEDKVKQDKLDAEIAADQKALWKDSGNADFFKEQREGENEKSKKDAGYQYISEQDFNTQLSDLENQLGWRQNWTTDYNEKMSITPFEDPQYDSYHDGFNRNLDESTELGKQIEELKKRREWSGKVDEAAKSSYDTEENAAIAFAGLAVTETGNDHLERAAVIIHKQVPTVDKNGNIVMQSKYVLKDTFVGEHDNVIKGLLSSYAESLGDLSQGDTISFVHTHPY